MRQGRHLNFITVKNYFSCVLITNFRPETVSFILLFSLYFTSMKTHITYYLNKYIEIKLKLWRRNLLKRAEWQEKKPSKNIFIVNPIWGKFGKYKRLNNSIWIINFLLMQLFSNWWKKLNWFNVVIKLNCLLKEGFILPLGGTDDLLRLSTRTWSTILFCGGWAWKANNVILIKQDTKRGLWTVISYSIIEEGDKMGEIHDETGRPLVKDVIRVHWWRYLATYYV